MNTQLRPHPRSDPARKWWRGAAIYQIYPRSFADTDGNGVGDLPGITAHLDHVAALGVDAIWLSPFFKSPMKDFGYDVSDYLKVDPLFGTLADFDALVARAHALGLRVIIDQVYSHTSDDHAWFRESRADPTNPKADWYVWADAKPDGSPPTNWQSVFGGAAWTWDARRGQYYLHNFLSSQPNVNLHNPLVDAALLGVARFWLDRGVDGFRLDAINFAAHDPMLRDNPPAANSGAVRTRPFDFQQHIYNQSHPIIARFVERVRALTDEYGEVFTVAEVGGADPIEEMHRFTAQPGGLNSVYGFDFLYAPKIYPKLIEKVLGDWPDRPELGWPSWAFSNHDAPRAASRWASEADHTEMARLNLLLLISLRGNIFVYQGEELGLTQARIAFKDLRDPEAIANWPLTLGRDGARTPMPWNSTAPHAGFSTAAPWLPLPQDHRALAVDRQNDDDASQLTLTRSLLKMRAHHDALSIGAAKMIVADNQRLVLERTAGRERLLCVFNLGTTPAAWAPAQPDQWRVLAAVNGATTWNLPPLSGLIAEATA